MLSNNIGPNIEPPNQRDSTGTNPVNRKLRDFLFLTNNLNGLNSIDSLNDLLDSPSHILRTFLEV